nr:hypothetical protein [uncultured Azospirillum sp.]
MTMKTERFEMRTSAAFARVIDEWRRKQDLIPSRSDAVRSLVTQGLMYENLHIAFGKIIRCVADGAEQGKVSKDIADAVAEMMNPVVRDLEDYRDSQSDELREMKEVFSEISQLREADPEGFAKKYPNLLAKKAP